MIRVTSALSAILALSLTALVGSIQSTLTGRVIAAAHAADQNSDEVFPPGMTAPAPAPSPTSARRPRDTKRDAGRDAEATADPNRFEADTVIKSTYQLDGKPLEVDPD